MGWQQAINNVATPVDSFYLLPTLQNWVSKTTDDVTSLQLTDETRIIDLTSRKASIRIQVDNAQVIKDSIGLHLNYLNGQLFMKEK